MRKEERKRNQKKEGVEIIKLYNTAAHGAV